MESEGTKLRTKRKSFSKSGKLLCLVLAVVLMIGAMPVYGTFASAGTDEPTVETTDETPSPSAEPATPEPAAAPAPQGEPEATPTPSAEVTPSQEPEASPTPGATPTESPEPSATPENTTYANSISGMLWLDMFDDIENSIYAGDGTRQAEESPLAGYTVELYKADDTDNAVATTTTSANGRYSFENIDPGSYIVGVKTTTMNGVEYLLPFYYLTGTEGDNRFVATLDEDADAYIYAYTAPITIAEDTAITGIDAGIRTVPVMQPMADFAIDLATLTNGDSGTGWTFSSGVLTFDGTAIGNAYTITTSASTTNRIVVNTGSSTAFGITLSGVTISSVGSSLDLQGSSNVDLTLTGVNVLTVTSGNAACVQVSSTAKITIDGTGSLDATGSSSGNGAGIGSGGGYSNGEIIINGGTITANGNSGGGAGIGGGGNPSTPSTSGGTITINGGTITANGHGGGAGIGGGRGSSTGGNGGTITINSGIVIATGDNSSGYSAAGIGGGYAANGTGGSGGTIKITGGTVTASGTSLGAGIGGGGATNGPGGAGGTITISGGTVTATGGYRGAGIGGAGANYSPSSAGSAGNITITGGRITAKGGTYLISSTEPYAGGIGGSTYRGASAYLRNTSGTIIFTGGSIYPSTNNGVVGDNAVFPSPTNGNIYGAPDTVYFNTISSSVSGKTAGQRFVIEAIGTKQDYLYPMLIHHDGTDNAYPWVPSYRLLAPEAVTNAATSVAATNATLNGTYNTKSLDGNVYYEYGTTSGNYTNTATYSTTATSSSATSGPQGITGLTAGTTYYFRIVVESDGGATAYGAEMSFTTLTPSAVTSPVGTVTSSSAVLNGIYNTAGESGTVQFEYGTSSTLATYTAVDSASVNVSADTNKTYTLTNLTDTTTYYYRIVTIVDGVRYEGSIETFTTLLPYHTITEKYVDQSGNPIVISGTPVVDTSQTVAPAGTYSGAAATIPGYVCVGHRIGSSTDTFATATAGTSGDTTPSITNVAADQTVYYVYAIAQGSIKIEKYANGGTTPLSGATFKLDKLVSSGGAVDTSFTALTQPATGGTTTFSNLPAGIYRVTETVAPANHDPLIEAFEVTIPTDVTLTSSQTPEAGYLYSTTSGGNITYHYYDVTYKVSDQASIAMPSAGVINTLPPYALWGGGIILLAALSGSILWLKRRRAYKPKHG